MSKNMIIQSIYKQAQNEYYKRTLTEASSFYNRRVPADRQLGRLSIKAKDVQQYVYQDVNPKDKEIFEYLISNRIIPTIVSSPDLRNNPYYELEDKLIQLVGNTGSSRTYEIPYCDNAGSINTKTITILDGDGGIVEFGDKWIELSRFYKLKPSTLKRYFWK